MQEKLRFLGLDVHAETIAAATAFHDTALSNYRSLAGFWRLIRRRFFRNGQEAVVMAKRGFTTFEPFAFP
jgi:hypothetical protein